MTTLALVLIIAAVLSPLIVRDLRRAVVRRRARIRGRIQRQQLKEAMVRFRIELVDNFTPALRRVAEAASKTTRDLEAFRRAFEEGQS